MENSNYDHIPKMFLKRKETRKINYRGISLLNTPPKLTTRIISSKMIKSISLKDEQQGFRTARQCTHAVFVIRQIKNKSLEYNKSAYMRIRGLEKAQVNIDRVKIGF